MNEFNTAGLKAERQTLEAAYIKAEAIENKARAAYAVSEVAAIQAWRESAEGIAVSTAFHKARAKSIAAYEAAYH